MVTIVDLAAIVLDGAGIGTERLVDWIVRAKHIGEKQSSPEILGLVYDL